MKRLYRSKDERVINGFCGGLGRYLDMDPVVIRLLWIVLTLLSLGTGILVYLIAWIIVPEEGPEDHPGTAA